MAVNDHAHTTVDTNAATSPEQRAQAAAYIRRHAHNDADRNLLLTALGLETDREPAP